MKLTSVDKLMQEQRRELAAAARKVRPDAKFRSEFAQLMQQRRELRQNHSPPPLLGGGDSEAPARRGLNSRSAMPGLATFFKLQRRDERK
jgi:hypothetical protein